MLCCICHVPTNNKLCVFHAQADDKAIALQVPSAAATQQESAAATQVPLISVPILRYLIGVGLQPVG